jgi:hypothetical protein
MFIFLVVYGIVYMPALLSHTPEYLEINTVNLRISSNISHGLIFNNY